jgi:hypothetical protein
VVTRGGSFGGGPDVSYEPDHLDIHDMQSKCCTEKLEQMRLSWSQRRPTSDLGGNGLDKVAEC